MYFCVNFAVVFDVVGEGVGQRGYAPGRVLTLYIGVGDCDPSAVAFFSTLVLVLFGIDDHRAGVLECRLLI